MSCGGFIQRIGAPPIVRRTTFYTACLPIRAAIGYVLFQYGRTDPELVAWTVFAICLFACIMTLSRDAEERKALHDKEANESKTDDKSSTNDQDKECRVWWSRRVHALMLGFLAFSAIMVMYRIFSADVLAIVWMLDVIFGLVSSFFWATF